MILKQKAIDIAKAFTKWGLWKSIDIDIPIANANNTGLVKGGGNVEISEDGTMNVDLSGIDAEISALNNSKSGVLERTTTTKTFSLQAGVDTPFSFAVLNSNKIPLMWNLKYNFSSAVTLGCENVNFSRAGRFTCSGFMRSAVDLPIKITLHVLWVDATQIE